MFANRKNPMFRGSGWRMHIHVLVHVLAIWPTKVKDQHHIMSRIQNFFKKRGVGGGGRWGDWHEEHEHRRLKPWSGIHVHVRGSGFYRVYILGMFWDDGSTCKLLDFFSRGKGVVAWGLDFHIVKKIVKFVSIFVLIISDVICNYKLLIW